MLAYHQMHIYKKMKKGPLANPKPRLFEDGLCANQCHSIAVGKESVSSLPVHSAARGRVK